MQQPTARRPSEKYNKLLSIIRFSSTLIGVDVIAENYKFNWVVGFVFAAIGWNFFCSSYTIWKDVTTDWTVLLDVFSPISCAAQGTIKLFSLVCYPKLYRKLALDLGEIYEKYQLLGQKYENKLLTWNKDMKRLLIIGGLIYFASAWIALITPLGLYILKGEKHLIIMCQMPYIDGSTNQGYFILIGYNLICVFVASFGLYAFDLYVFLFLTHSIFFYDIFALKVDDLHEVLRQNDKDNACCHWSMILPSGTSTTWSEFNDHCNLIFFWPITSHILCTTLGILSTLLIIMLKYWPGAYPYIFVCFVWLYMYSFLGTRVEICNDQFCDGIYDIKWYDLDLKNQKTVCLMLTESQVPRIITIAGVEPLSMNTALKITRSIYSLAMMWSEMFSPKQPSENHAQLIKVLRFCARQIGCDVLEENFKFNRTMGAVLIAIIWYYLCSVYQIAKDFATDWTILLDVCSPVSCTTQGLVKLISVLLYPKLYYQLAGEIKETYEKYEKMGTKYKDILHRWNKAMKKIIVFLAMVYLLTAVLMLSTPLALYIFKGERHLILLLQMPFTDVTTTRGYLSATIFNVMCIFIGSFGLFAADSFLFLYLSHSLFFYDIFAQKIEDLHELLEHNRQDERKTALMNDINDRFCAGIYDIKWYDLDLSNQKTVNLMLTQSQVPRIITIAGVEPLSMNTALRITRSIYSLVMMVVQLNE
ncbi:unnamed protein product [Ceratitis capitata]|uniref:(Mediterranean fruit fly) hypothetical protein n=1 Tax=Ceratitis capitata TaxID=7213 RepID=A0A811U787_CERCA|nr:unnamed protein product [Ceratitis capitata]